MEDVTNCTYRLDIVNLGVDGVRVGDGRTHPGRAGARARKPAQDGGVGLGRHTADTLRQVRCRRNEQSEERTGSLVAMVGGDSSESSESDMLLGRRDASMASQSLAGDLYV